MKTKPSSYVLAAEILIIILFHAVKIRQSEKHPAEIVFTPAAKTVPLPKMRLLKTRPAQNTCL